MSVFLPFLPPHFPIPSSTIYQSTSPLALSKPRAKIRLFTRVSVEKLTKKQHNFLSDKKLCFLLYLEFLVFL